MSAPIDPAFDMPFADYGQTGSFVAPVALPSVGPLDAPLVSLPCINPQWLKLVLGCVDQLRVRSSWLASYTDAQIVAILGAVEQLRVALQMANPCCDVVLRLEPNCVLQYSTDGGSSWVDVTDWAANFANCVLGVIIPPVPELPPGQTNPQRACNIAGFLAIDLVQQAIQQAIVVFNQNKTLVNYITTILPIFSYAFPITTFGLDAFVFLYNFITSANIADFEAAQNDASLFNLVRCAVYNAIKVDGYVTPANKGAICSNIGGIVYTHQDVITAIAGFCNGLSYEQLAAMQNVGVWNDPQDCSGCGGWCYLWDFYPAASPNWAITGPAGEWVSGWGYRNVVGTSQDIWIDMHIQPQFLSQVDITFGSFDTEGAEARDIKYYHNGSLVHTNSLDPGAYNSEHTQTFNDMGGITIDEVLVQVGVVSTASRVWVHSIRLHGAGVSPTGVSNC